MSIEWLEVAVHVNLSTVSSGEAKMYLSILWVFKSVEASTVGIINIRVVDFNSVLSFNNKAKQIYPISCGSVSYTKSNGANLKRGSRSLLFHW